MIEPKVRRLSPLR